VQNLLSSGLISKNLKIKVCRTILLPVVLYGYETWSLLLRQECRLRAFENRVARRIFGLKRDKVTREWRQLRNEKLYSLPNIVWVIKKRIPSISSDESTGSCICLRQHIYMSHVLLPCISFITRIGCLFSVLCLLLLLFS
jgi:hypothetical protein